MANVEDASGSPHCHVLGDNPGILNRHVPAIEIDHLRAQLSVSGIERGFADCGRGFDRRQERTSITRWGLGHRIELRSLSCAELSLQPKAAWICMAWSRRGGLWLVTGGS